MIALKRIRWELEEMVAMVDLYYRDKNGEVDNLNDELSELSRKLNKREDILDIDHDYKFRNLNGMKMIFQNVLYADTDGEKGMANTSRLIYDTIDLYNKKNDCFTAILNDFNDKYS